MREKWQEQMPLMPAEIDHPQAKELEAISRIIDSKPTICERVLQDLQRHGKPRHRSGAKAMSAEQVLRAAIVKMLFGFSYVELAFHLVDSHCIRRFCRIGIADKGFKKSVLNRHVKSLSTDTWQAIHRDLLDYASANKIEKGRKVRIDSTVVESNIHTPSDSTLLCDAVRVITRLLCQTRDLGVRPFAFSDHRLRAKRRMLNIQYAKNVKQRRPAYRELVKLAGKCLGYASQALDRLSTATSVKAMMLSFHFVTTPA
jgi:IS5 family transposase